MSKPGSRTIARLIVLLLVLAGLALAIFLATMDLNRYREQISSTLSSILKRPVTFSHIGFSMAHGLAVDCQELVVSTGEQDDNSLTADHLYLKVALLPLFKGELALREIILDRPRLFLDLTSTSAEPPQQQSEAQTVLTDQLGDIHLHKGAIELLLPSPQGEPTRIKLDELDLMLQERGNNRLGVEFSSQLTLGRKKSQLSLKGELGRPNWPDWRENRVALELFGRDLPLRELLTLAGSGPLQLTGPADLALSLQGAVAGGLTFGADLKAKQAGYSYRGSAPLPLGDWQMRGVWRHPVAAEHSLDNLTLDHQKLRLTGNLVRKNGAIQGDLKLRQTALSSLWQLVPETLATNRIKELLPQGDISLTAQLPPTSLNELDWPTLLRQTTATARLHQLSWQPPGWPLIQQGEGRLELAAGRVKISQLQAVWQQRPQSLSGTIDLTATQPEYNLQAQLEPPLAEASRILSEQSGEQIALTGEAVLDLKLTGTRSRPTIALHADLGPLTGSLGDWYQKPLDQAGEVDLKFGLNDTTWTISDSHLSLDGQTIAFSGIRRQDGTLNLALKASDFNLESLGQQIRRLAPHHPRGRIDLDLTFARSQTTPATVKGLVSLNQVGIHLVPLLADINHANGTIIFHGKGLETVLINAHLGASPVTLQAELPDFSDPSLTLHLQGETVRADELIFRSHLAYLRDLDGRLTIDKKGIGFDLVTVRLDGGTDCQVRGMMLGWKQAHVALDIDASYGNIDEVINLWQDPAPDSPKAVAADHRQPGPTVDIEVRAEKGRIHRLAFERATGTITSNGMGLLSVFPLQFHSGDGHGVGQVVADSSKGPTTLIISGHLENFPAATIYKDLLQRDSLVSGTLRGDFHLEGLAGQGFSKTSNGGVNVEIKKGVLKKFHFLSKVFSLLNISQILSLELPDMAEEGMPFHSTTGTFSLTQGLLRSEDLLVNSEAMDLSLVADYDILTNRINGILGVKPLKTVDKIITKIPIAGWLLTGEDKALITAHFSITGNADNPDVLAVPITSLSSKVFGIFKRVLTLPGEVITDPGRVILPQSANPKE